MNTLKKLLTLAPVTVIVLGFGLQPAKADVYTLSIANSGLGGGTGNWGTVSVTNGLTNQVNILVTLNNSTFASTGLLDFAFSLGSISSATISNETVNGVSSNVFLPTGSQNAAQNHDDGFGYFGYYLDCGSGCPNGGGGSYTSLGFTVTATGLTKDSFTLSLDKQGNLNSPAVYFAADVYDQSSQKTGLVGAPDPGQPAPDGGTTALLLGMALSIGGFLKRRLQ
jgi:hypothetical protein